jgi:thiamine-phosphate pyrophosphorylase
MQSIASFADRLKIRAQRRRRGLPALWLMTDAVRMRDPVAAIMRLPAGSGVIVRHTDSARLRRLAEEIVPLCRRRKLMCLIAGDWRLAARLGADGLHLAERDARFGHSSAALGWRRQRGRMLTSAAHGHAAARRGARLGVDAILLAPVFATASHPHARTLGATRFAALVRATSCAVIALGGITTHTMQRIAASGAWGIAGIAWAET